MMYDKDKLLLKIANAIVANIGNITRNGLLDGKTGVAFFLYMYARYSGIKFYSDVADDMLERLLAVSHDREAVDAKCGRTSVAIGLMQMAYNGFVEMEQDVFEDADKSILVADYKLMELESSLDKPVYTQGIYLVKSLLYRNFVLDGTEVTRIVENIEKYMVKCVLEKTMPLKVSMADSFIYVLGVLLRRKLISRERYDGVLHMIKPFLPVGQLERSFFCGALTDFKHDMEMCGKYCNVKDRFSMLLSNILYDNEKCQVSEICECIDDFELALHDSYFERDIIYGQMAVVGINLLK